MKKTLIPQSYRYVRVDHIYGTSTLYFFVHNWNDQSDWKSFKTDGSATKPTKVLFYDLYNSYC